MTCLLNALKLMAVISLDGLPEKVWRKRLDSLILGGVTSFQAREKKGPYSQQAKHMAALKKALDGTGIPIIVNDTLQLVVDFDANGLHIGESDTPPHMARAAIGPNPWLGVSLTSVDSLGYYGINNLEKAAVDYYGIGPVFSTKSKQDAAPELGIQGTQTLISLVACPTIAIGGITPENVRAVMSAGLNGVAAISSLWEASDPVSGARNLRRWII